MSTKSYIECVGVAGSGKTTLAKLLVETLRTRGLKAEIRQPLGMQLLLKTRLVFDMGALILRHPSIVFLLFVTIRGSFMSVPHVRKTVFDLVFRTIVDTVVIRYLLRHTSGILINDESQVGKVVALQTLTHISEQRALKIIRAILPVPSKLIFIEVSSEIVMEREEKRDTQLKFFNDMEQETKAYFFEQNILLYQSLKKQLVGVQSVLVSNTGDNDALVQQLERISSDL